MLHGKEAGLQGEEAPLAAAGQTWPQAALECTQTPQEEPPDRDVFH